MKELVLREIISGCLCTSLSSVHGHTNADTRQQKNSSNFQMATFSYVCQFSLISIRKQIKSVVCHRHIPTKGDVMCYLFNDLETQLDETCPNCAGDHDENQVDEYSDGSDSSDSEMDIDDEIEDDLTFLRTTRSGRSITINRSLF